MKRTFNILRYFLVFALIFGVGNLGQAGGKKNKNKKKHLSISIKAAMKRSNYEQNRIKDRMESEADQRAESWRDRQMDTIEIKHSGVSSIEAAELGSPDFSMEELGEDSSGLNRLRSDFEEEPTENINFDEELREVSSMKD